MNKTLIRSLSGVLFLILVTGSMLWGPVIFALVIILALLITTNEFLTISLKDKFKYPKLITLFTSLLLYLLFFLYYHNNIDIKYFWLLVLPFISIVVSILYSKESMSENYNRTAYLVMAPLYIALPFALTNTILFSQGTYLPNILLSIFIILWSCDVGAYVFGISFGQKNGHKLFPSISPKKSWEGFIGGLISALITGFILYKVELISFSLIDVLAISVIIFTAGVFGDLVESLFKRNFGVKDSGNIMPGHGGLLDRFDSALLALPAAIAYIKLFDLI